jgi:hypothetical protein
MGSVTLYMYNHKEGREWGKDCDEDGRSHRSAGVSCLTMAIIATKKSDNWI